MKTVIWLLILTMILFGCTSNRYLLIDKGKDKYFLVDFIKLEAKKGEISNKPLIVVDGVPYRFDNELKEKRLNLSKDDIKQIDRVNEEVGIKIYGDFAKGGVLLITTKTKPK